MTVSNDAGFSQVSDAGKVQSNDLFEVGEIRRAVLDQVVVIQLIRRHQAAGEQIVLADGDTGKIKVGRDKQAAVHQVSQANIGKTGQIAHGNNVLALGILSYIHIQDRHLKNVRFHEVFYVHRALHEHVVKINRRKNGFQITFADQAVNEQVSDADIGLTDEIGDLDTVAVQNISIIVQVFDNTLGKPESVEIGFGQISQVFPGQFAEINDVADSEITHFDDFRQAVTLDQAGIDDVGIGEHVGIDLTQRPYVVMIDNTEIDQVMEFYRYIDIGKEGVEIDDRTRTDQGAVA